MLGAARAAITGFFDLLRYWALQHWASLLDAAQEPSVARALHARVFCESHFPTIWHMPAIETTP